jgi:hypothetical protein
MRNKYLLRACISVLIVLFGVLLASCELPKSIVERIGSFEDFLNKADRTGIHENFHPTETADYDSMKNPSLYFGGSILDAANIPFDFTNIDTTDPNNVTATMTNVNTSYDVYFIMIQDGAGWLIHEFHVTNPTTLDIKNVF